LKLSIKKFLESFYMDSAAGSFACRWSWGRCI
jgi:hypothetical protein